MEWIYLLASAQEAAWTFHMISWGLVGMVWVGSSRSGSWSAAVRRMCPCFGYRWDACEHWSFLATSVTPVSLRPLITMGNLGVWSCLDIV
jgi:hypothetical protein